METAWNEGNNAVISMNVLALGKGEADSSILSGSTIKTPVNAGFSGQTSPVQMAGLGRTEQEHTRGLRGKSVERVASLFMGKETGSMEILSRQSPSERINSLLTAWRTAPDDTDIEMRIGQIEDGRPAILVSIGAVDTPFSADEADALAAIAGRHKLPSDFRNLIDAIVRASTASRLTPTL